MQNILHHILEPHTAAEYFLYLLIIPVAMIGFDLSGAPTRIKRWLFYMKYYKKVKFKMFSLKPLDCPACLSSWTVFIVSLNPITALATYALCYISNKLIEKI